MALYAHSFAPTQREGIQHFSSFALFTAIFRTTTGFSGDTFNFYNTIVKSQNFFVQTNVSEGRDGLCETTTCGPFGALFNFYHIDTQAVIQMVLLAGESVRWA